MYMCSYRILTYCAVKERDCDWHLASNANQQASSMHWLSTNRVKTTHQLLTLVGVFLQHTSISCLLAQSAACMQATLNAAGAPPPEGWREGGGG